jgi:hypothetical protein|tara:strand:+ start:131 stop:919 length:789 start_codon:yes stop_codon:yes gene_type:complete
MLINMTRTLQSYQLVKPIIKRYLQIEFKQVTTEEIKGLLKYYTSRSSRTLPNPVKIGQLRKEFYYRKKLGGAAVAEKHPDIFTESGPKSRQTLDRQDRVLRKTVPDPAKDPVRALMSNGLTLREEKYAMAYFASADPLQAWVDAGYDTSYTAWQNHAWATREKPRIKARILELLEEVKVKMTWNADKVLEKFDTIYQKSLEEQDFTNATRSMENIAKHLGMFVDRSESRVGNLDGVKTDDLDGDISKLAGMVGLKVVNGGKP